MQTPAKFEYTRATSVDDALATLQRLGGSARIVAGGHQRPYESVQRRLMLGVKSKELVFVGFGLHVLTACEAGMTCEDRM